MPAARRRRPRGPRKKATAARIVASGDVVGIRIVAGSSGPVPMPQMNFVPLLRLRQTLLSALGRLSRHQPYWTYQAGK